MTITAQEIHKKLESSKEDTHHLVLSALFNLVFGRKLRSNEWGFFRKLLRIYGSEILYWALLASANINSDTTPLVYVSKVCSGMLRESVSVPAGDTCTEDEALRILAELQKEQDEWRKLHG